MRSLQETPLSAKTAFTPVNPVCGSRQLGFFFYKRTAMGPLT
jgi:hypothetical protein